MKRRSLKQIFAEEESLPATYNTELASYLKKYDGYRGYKFFGVIMRDTVKFVKNCNKCFYIVNYDKRTQSGSHWVAVVKNGTSVYHMGSYGISPLKEIQDRYPKSKIYYNDRAIQQSDSNICGHLALNFIESMIEGNLSFKEWLQEALRYSNRYRINVLNNNRNGTIT